jgi:hypothetical protein
LVLRFCTHHTPPDGCEFWMAKIGDASFLIF